MRQRRNQKNNLYTDFQQSMVVQELPAGTHVSHRSGDKLPARTPWIVLYVARLFKSMKFTNRSTLLYVVMLIHNIQSHIINVLTLWMKRQSFNCKLVNYHLQLIMVDINNILQLEEETGNWSERATSFVQVA